MVRLRRPSVAAGLLVATYIGVFGRLTWAQHENFGTFGYDMGLYDQGIWLLSRFKDPFVTIRGLHFFQHHVNLITVLFVPAYWLGAGPHFLYLVETVWMALGAVPLYLLARDRLESGWLGVAVAACFLLYPSLEWINWWHFHPDAIASPDFDPRSAIEFWDITNRQDWDLSELAQRGISSRGYQPGPYSNREELLHGLDRFVQERVGSTR